MGTTPVIGGMNIVLAGDAATFSQAVDQAQKRLDQLAGRSRSFARGTASDFGAAGRSAEAFGHSTVTSVQAASGALRELNGDFVNNIRAVERFITTIPGVGNALKFAFPLVGGLAFASMIGEGIVKVNEFIAKLRAIPKGIADGFSELNSQTKLTNDALDVENARLDMTLAKLQHRPENGLALQLAQITEAADKGTKALQEEISKADELMKKNRSGFWQGLAGKSPTDPDAKDISGFNQRIKDVSDNYVDPIAAAAGRGDIKNVTNLKQQQLAELEKVYADATSKIGNRLKDLEGLQGNKAYKAFGGDDLTARINQMRGALRGWDEEQKQLGGEYRKGTTEGAIAPLQAAAGSGETANKANEQRLKTMEANLSEEKLLHSMSVKEVYDFWAARRTAFTAGSQQYDAVVSKMADLAMESAKASHDRIAKFNVSSTKGDAEEYQRALESAVKGVAGMGRDRQRTSDEGFVDSNQLAILEAHNDAHEKEAAIMDRAGASISRYAAAIQVAQIHAQEFATEMTALQAVLSIRTRENSSNPSAQTGKALEDAQAAIAKAQSARTIQAQGDSDAIYGRQTSGLVGATDALDEFVKSTRDSASQLREFTQNTLSGFNDVAIHALTTRTTGWENRQAFGNYGAGLARSVAGMGLNKLEGSTLGMLGLGGGKKPSGTASDPIHVVLAKVDSIANATGGFLGRIFGGSGGSAPGVNPALAAALAGTSSGGMINTVSSDVKSLIPLLPAFASGGAISAGTAAIIGEKGPELFMPNSSGTIIPNHQLGGGGGDTHISVDARGATDPAIVAAAAHRAVMAAVPHIVAQSVKVNRDQARRAPTNKR